MIEREALTAAETAAIFDALSQVTRLEAFRLLSRFHPFGLAAGDLARLLAVAEGYPQLRASEVFIDLQRRITALEEQIAHRREFYNAAVNINNVRMEQFPDSLLTSLVGLVPRPLFESKQAERDDVDVAARLGS